jgi:hypothetical protein
MPAPTDTPKIIARLRAMRAAGATNRACADALNIADSTLRRWLHKHHITGPRPLSNGQKRRLDAAGVAQVRELREAGQSVQEVATALGLSYRIVARTCREHGIMGPSRGPGRPAQAPPVVPAPRAQKPPTGPALARNGQWAVTPAAKRKQPQRVVSEAPRVRSYLHPPLGEWLLPPPSWCAAWCEECAAKLRRAA